MHARRSKLHTNLNNNSTRPACESRVHDLQLAVCKKPAGAQVQISEWSNELSNHEKER